ncbi:ATP-dependent dethiobiotin synthetase BioD [Clostridium botulinum]|uniref:ATP-dependent dethiobiotin synthetase BioD n=1 Tax=Clostridium botulinum (strain Eklund 17B / Type B) TaxID=935198 RepID=BIOD_CLOBB|nr:MULTISPECIES: dethiobiotin synthase [unclassified Clostridium]B2TL74.1 RecName: Full=ATP-dependent dethiobiotin synthetase BioD; AltName: Full=DTB synthetase; Short=DTBS; AltName: Full=Dethiobiotin synthase [Clostridium botulinum B str. Eklund 17B (NRP)]MBN1051054.1 ATP-dependent dethiobiotin synthetase BioD [Clostridium botulinum]ACD22651.1 dethiobiotin synthase [Clostridium botulinum B str. Eklund 17B (NRP)]MBN1054345.1 ATP-dependent dethiobiotin synthetase BioD [Clostridium botulinum]MBY
MAKGVFITATNTDIGKTYITALIVKKLREANINCGYYKAALSGAEIINNNIVAGDAKYVYNVANIKGNPNECVSYIFKQAVSPHLAAKLNNVHISMDKIVADFNYRCNEHDYITVEGSGGIICPIYYDKEKIMLTDIIKKLKIPIILVSPSGLGSINGTILTLEYIKKHNLVVNSIILNNYDKSNIIHIDNKRILEEMTNLPVYTCEQYSEDIDIPLKELKQFYDFI